MYRNQKAYLRMLILWKNNNNTKWVLGFLDLLISIKQWMPYQKQKDRENCLSSEAYLYRQRELDQLWLVLSISLVKKELNAILGILVLCPFKLYKRQRKLKDLLFNSDQVTFLVSLSIGAVRDLLIKLDFLNSLPWTTDVYKLISHYYKLSEYV